MIWPSVVLKNPPKPFWNTLTTSPPYNLIQKSLVPKPNSPLYKTASEKTGTHPTPVLKSLNITRSLFQAPAGGMWWKKGSIREENMVPHPRSLVMEDLVWGEGAAPACAPGMWRAPSVQRLQRTRGRFQRPGHLGLFSRSVVSDSLWTHGLQHARLPCPSLSPGVCSNSCPLSWWCHPTISSSVTPLLPLPSIFPSIRVFSSESALCIRWPSTGASVSVLPMNVQGWFPLGLTGLSSLLSKGSISAGTAENLWRIREARTFRGQQANREFWGDLRPRVGDQSASQ